MAKDSSDKPNDSVPENPPSPKDESTSDGQEATQDALVPEDVDALLAQAEDSLTDLDNQVPHPSESTEETQPVPSDSQAAENPAEDQDSPPAQQPTMQQEKIDQALNNLEEDVHSLNQQVGDTPQEQTEEPNPQVESLDSSEQKDASQTDSQDDDSSEDQLPDEDIDDVLASLADELSDPAPDTPETAVDPTPPVDLAPTETDDEDEQIAEDEINALLNQAEKPPGMEDSSTAPPADQTETPAESTPQQQTNPPEAQSQEETNADQQENQSAQADEKAPAQEQASPAAQEQEQDPEPEADFTTQPEPAADEEDPETLTDADEAMEKSIKVTPEDIAQFPLPQRLAINTMVGINKPFSFVPEKVKDLLGIAAVITVLLSVLTTALILFILD